MPVEYDSPIDSLRRLAENALTPRLGHFKYAPQFLNFNRSIRISFARGKFRFLLRKVQWESVEKPLSVLFSFYIADLRCRAGILIPDRHFA